MKKANAYLMVAVNVLEEAREEDVLEALCVALYGGGLCLAEDGVAVQSIKINHYEEA